VSRTDRLTYAALHELIARYEGYDDGSLTRYEHRVFSQNGEDGVIAEILRRIGCANRWFVEFGAETGAEANCVTLADVAGWSGLFMEAGEDRSNELRRKYRAYRKITAQRSFVTVDNIEELFAAAGAPNDLDVLSIDVDGNDFWLWRALTNYRPRLVVIEYNADFDPRRSFVQDYDPERMWDGTVHYGASLGALEWLAETKGYRLVHTELSGNNAFFVPVEFAAEFPGEVPRRGPNFWLTGDSHPPHPPAPPRYLEVPGDL
jgi:hypothetical protein